MGRGARLRAIAGATVAALALVGATPAAAEEVERNTWKGVCEEIPGFAHWTEPIGLVPRDFGMVLLADFEGGTCTGEVNGEPVEDIPALVHIEYYGVHTCEAGYVRGPMRFEFEGKEFWGIAQYQRAGIVMRVMIEGHPSGQPIHAVVRGAGEGPNYDPQPLFDYVGGCVGEGTSDAEVRIVRSLTFGFVGLTEEEARDARWPPPLPSE